MKPNPSAPAGLALEGASAVLRGLSVESTTACAARLASAPLQSQRGSRGILRQAPSGAAARTRCELRVAQPLGAERAELDAVGWSGAHSHRQTLHLVSAHRRQGAQPQLEFALSAQAQATNVLSFAGAGVAPDGRSFLGELVICAPLVALEARAQDKTLPCSLGASHHPRRPAPAGFRSRTRDGGQENGRPRDSKSLIGLGFQTPTADPVCSHPMSEQPHGATTGRWLKRITQSMSGEPRDLASWSRVCARRVSGDFSTAMRWSCSRASWPSRTCR